MSTSRRHDAFLVAMLKGAVVQGSEEWMAPVMMTALTAGLALRPMGEVILGGLLSSTALNLVVVPGLFACWGLAVAQGDDQGRAES